jgi:LysR family transcriptional regulator, nitrogen assimilation regulatory protein
VLICPLSVKTIFPRFNIIFRVGARIFCLSADATPNRQWSRRRRMSSGVTLSDYRMVVAVYEEGSFTMAAERLHATQSGVSQHIRKLEQRFRTPLFVRYKGKVVATPAGERLYERTVHLLCVEQKTQREICGFATGGEVIALGMTPFLSQISAKAIASMIGEFPKASIRILEGASDGLSDQVRDGRLDIAVVPRARCKPGLSQRLFLRTNEFIVSARGKKAPNEATNPLRGSGPLKIVLPGRRCERRERIESYLVASDAEVEHRLEIDGPLATLSFIRGTDWVTILPDISFAKGWAETDFTFFPVNKSGFGDGIRRRITPPPTAIAAYRYVSRSLAGERHCIDA